MADSFDGPTAALDLKSVEDMHAMVLRIADVLVMGAASRGYAGSAGAQLDLIRSYVEQYMPELLGD